MTTTRYDYVIVGGGSAGCVLAARLSEDPARSVLLLEAGPDYPESLLPADLLDGTHGPSTDGHDWGLAGWSGPDGHDLALARGRVTGGCSAVNATFALRGAPADYDAWAALGNPGWAFADVLPYFKRLENFVDGESALRGAGGPIDIVHVTERPPIARAFIEAARQAGFRENPDYNAEDQEGFGYYQVNQRNGRRWSAADAYLRPAFGRRNLDVRTHSHVQRIDFEGRCATGVTFRIGSEIRHVNAHREVILAAGSVQTPHLLELSGVGNPSALKAAGLEVLHPLAGVGENYIDHFATRMSWRVKQAVTLNEASRGWRLGVAVGRYLLTHKGILSLGTGLVGGFVKTRAELDSPDVQYFFMHASYANAADRRLDREPGMTIGVTQLRPRSRGSIHARSPDPDAPPAMRPNFLSAPGDAETLVEGMRIARRIIEQHAMDRFRAYEMNPGPTVTSDEAWLDFARRNGQTIYHAIGTCRMGSDPATSVAPRLKVRGLEGLRVVDASIMPTITSGNTNSPTIMIAEKASDLIRADRRARHSAGAARAATAAEPVAA